MDIQSLKIAANVLLCPNRTKAIELDQRITRPAKQKKVWPFAAPESHIGKMRRKCSKHHSEVIRGERIGLNPLYKHTAWRQPAPDGGVKFVREKCGNSRNPRVGRLRNDEVVFFSRG